MNAFLDSGALDSAMTAPTMTDPFGRAISYLRVSVTDRCDLRCFYCMSEDMTFLPKADLLTLEELDRLCSAFIAKGVRKLRLTGGEPLVRRNVISLFRSLSRHLQSGALNELTLTTNGSQLANFASQLAECGIKRINVSLDTLDPDKFRSITRWGDLPKVLAGIEAARAAGMKVKINAGGAEEPQRGRNPLADGVGARQRHGPDADRSDANGRCLRRAHRSICAALNAARAPRWQIHPHRSRRDQRRPGALCARQRDWRQARPDHGR